MPEASEILVYDIAADEGGARRPDIEDVGGARLEDDTEPGHEPNRSGVDPYAAMLNQLQMLATAHGRVASSVIATIDFAAAAPFIDRIQGLRSDLVANDLEVFDDGTGITRIEWTSTLLPAPTCDPELTINGGAAPTLGKIEMKLNWSGAVAGASTPGTHRIIITTWTAATESVAAALVNVRCTFRIN